MTAKLNTERDRQPDEERERERERQSRKLHIFYNHQSRNDLRLAFERETNHKETSTHTHTHAHIADVHLISPQYSWHDLCGLKVSSERGRGRGRERGRELQCCTCRFEVVATLTCRLFMAKKKNRSHLLIHLTYHRICLS